MVFTWDLYGIYMGLICSGVHSLLVWWGKGCRSGQGLGGHRVSEDGREEGEGRVNYGVRVYGRNWQLTGGVGMSMLAGNCRDGAGKVRV